MYICVKSSLLLRNVDLVCQTAIVRVAKVPSYFILYHSRQVGTSRAKNKANAKLQITDAPLMTTRGWHRLYMKVEKAIMMPQCCDCFAKSTWKASCLVFSLSVFWLRDIHWQMVCLSLVNSQCGLSLFLTLFRTVNYKLSFKFCFPWLWTRDSTPRTAQESCPQLRIAFL